MQPTLDDARRVLRASFGYTDFRPAQVDVIRSVLSGDDTLAILPTGGGKSLCYQIPAIVRGGLTVVVSPLISLMQDQVERLASRGVAAAYLNSTLAFADASRTLARAMSGELTLLYVAPERFEIPNFLDTLRRTGVSLLAVDEAHCISEWGHDFRPGFRRLGAVRRELGSPQIVALTATATPAVRDDIVRQLGLVRPRVHVAGFDRANLSYSVRACTGDAEKFRALLQMLDGRAQPTIVYASTRGMVELVARRLGRAGLRAVAYHAGLSDARRRVAQDAFMRGDAVVIVATNAFGMGIDKPDVRLVVHYAMPGTLEAYYQEAGRAGRDGGPSRCALLYDPGDRFTHEGFIRRAHPERRVVENVYATLVAHARDAVVPGDTVVRAECKNVSLEERAAAVAFLIRRDVLRRDEADEKRVRVRLLATPNRIRRELTEPVFADDVNMLRTLWRAHGARLYDVAEVALRDLGERSAHTARMRLDALRARQFIDVHATADDLRLMRPRAPLHAIVSWATVERRRAHELSKLDAMESYARATICRRAFVLRYFGDSASRARCAGCDNCLGNDHEPRGQLHRRGR